MSTYVVDLLAELDAARLAAVAAAARLRQCRAVLVELEHAADDANVELVDVARRRTQRAGRHRRTVDPRPPVTADPPPPPSELEAAAAAVIGVAMPPPRRPELVPGSRDAARALRRVRHP